MVISLGPGKFYGSSLPRPRIYTDVKFSTHRVDPPAGVNDPFLSWAEEAHWSMGGHSFTRLRQQGRIEGNVDRLRKFREKQAKLLPEVVPKAVVTDLGNAKVGKGKKRAGSASPPPAPMALKKRRFMDLFDSESDEEEEEEDVVVVRKKKPARKLVGEFDRVAMEMEGSRNGAEAGGVRTRRMASDEAVNEVADVGKQGNAKGAKKRKLKKETSQSSEDGSSSVRVSPRLAKLRSN